MKRVPAVVPPAVAVPPILTDFNDLNAGRCIIAVSTKPGVWDWCGPLDGQRQIQAVLARLGIRTAQMKLDDGRYALIGWWTPATTPKRKRY